MKIEKLRYTVRFKVDALPKAEALHYISQYTQAFNELCSLGFQVESIRCKEDLHREYYDYIKEKYTLKSQMKCSVIDKAWEALSSVKELNNQKVPRAPKSQGQALRLAHGYSYSILEDRKEKDLDKRKSKKILSIDLGLEQRVKIPLEIPTYRVGIFNDPEWTIKGADLFYKKKHLWLNVTIESFVEIPEPSGRVLGGDQGDKNTIVTSDGKIYNGRKLKKRKKRIKKLRSGLQSAAAKGSKSARRHLRKISEREKRFTADYLHCLSKDIIRRMSPGDILAMEDLKYIRNRGQFKGKSLRTMLNSWAFQELIRMLTYKGLAKGIIVKLVPAFHTSQNCSQCGFCSSSNRVTRDLHQCQECGYTLNADLNGARNISTIGQLGYMPNCRVPVNEPKAENGFAAERSKSQSPAKIS